MAAADRWRESHSSAPTVEANDEHKAVDAHLGSLGSPEASAPLATSASGGPRQEHGTNSFTVRGASTVDAQAATVLDATPAGSPAGGQTSPSREEARGEVSGRCAPVFGGQAVSKRGSFFKDPGKKVTVAPECRLAKPTASLKKPRGGPPANHVAEQRGSLPMTTAAKGARGPPSEEGLQGAVSALGPPSEEELSQGPQRSHSPVLPDGPVDERLVPIMDGRKHGACHTVSFRLGVRPRWSAFAPSRGKAPPTEGEAQEKTR